MFVCEYESFLLGVGHICRRCPPFVQVRGLRRQHHHQIGSISIPRNTYRSVRVISEVQSRYGGVIQPPKVFSMHVHDSLLLLLLTQKGRKWLREFLASVLKSGNDCRTAGPFWACTGCWNGNKYVFICAQNLNKNPFICSLLSPFQVRPVLEHPSQQFLQSLWSILITPRSDDEAYDRAQEEEAQR